MKVLLLTLFVAFVASAPIEDAQNAVEVVVNGLPEGQPLEIGDIVDIKLKEHVDGQLAATSNLLHPFTAMGIAEAEVIAAAENQPQPINIVEVAENAVSPVQVVEVAENIVDPVQVVDHEPVIVENEINPTPVVLPSPVLPEVVPEPVEPSPVAPEFIPKPVVLPEPVAPEVVVPEPVLPEGVPSPEVIPEPVAPEAPEALPVPEPQQPNGEIFNDGNVQVIMNTPEDTGILATLQSWVSLVMSYFNNGVQTTQQIL